MSSGITLKLPPHFGSWLESTGHHGISFFSASTAKLEAAVAPSGAEGSLLVWSCLAHVSWANRCHVSQLTD